jgi:hypothetical protein|tara:strand:+ start:264 stop:497 length:234 start_codon:yes stop_codon:yes gene_type:complete
LGLLKFILTFIVVYYIFKFLSRLYLAYVLNKFKNNPFSHTKNKSSDEKEGDVTIDKMPKGNSKNKNVGDYIDYEEID